MKGGLNHNNPQNKRQGFTWKALALCMMLTIIPWAVYVNFHPRLDKVLTVPSDTHTAGTDSSHKLGQLRNENTVMPSTPAKTEPIAPILAISRNPAVQQLPVLGLVPTDGTKPLFGLQHKGTDAIFALACNYPKIYYQVWNTAFGTCSCSSVLGVLDVIMRLI